MLKTRFGRGLSVAVALLLGLSGYPVQAAVPHMVGDEGVSSALAAAAKLRTDRIQLVRDALATPEARQEAARRGVHLEEASVAVATLTDAELADLAQRSQRVKDVVAGHRHSDNDTLVIVGLVLVVAGLVVLAAVGDFDDYDDYYEDDCWCY